MHGQHAFTLTAGAYKPPAYRDKIYFTVYTNDGPGTGYIDSTGKGFIMSGGTEFVSLDGVCYYTT